MIITQDVNFLYNLFPEAKDNGQKLMDAVKRYYSVGPFEPKVERKDDLIHITLDVDRIEADKQKYAKLVSLVENQQFFRVQSPGVLLRELVTGYTAHGEGAWIAF